MRNYKLLPFRCGCLCRICLSCSDMESVTVGVQFDNYTSGVKAYVCVYKLICVNGLWEDKWEAVTLF